MAVFSVTIILRLLNALGPTLPIQDLLDLVALPVEKVTKAVLRYLFQEYLKGPTVLYSINGITDSFKSDAVAVSNFMM